MPEVIALLNLFEPLRIEATVTPPTAVIRLSGEFDYAGRRSLEVCAHLDLTDVSALEIDLAGLTFIDSAGHRALSAYIQRHRSSGRQVCLANPQPQVQRLIDLVDDLDGPDLRQA